MSHDPTPATYADVGVLPSRAHAVGGGVGTGAASAVRFGTRRPVVSPRFPPVGEASIGFGKHAGRPLRELAASDPDYLRWMVSADFPEETKRVVRGALDGQFPMPHTG